LYYLIPKILRNIPRSIFGDFITMIFIFAPPDFAHRFKSLIPPQRKPIPTASHQNHQGSIRAMSMAAPIEAKMKPMRFCPGCQCLLMANAAFSFYCSKSFSLQYTQKTA